MLNRCITDKSRKLVVTKRFENIINFIKFYQERETVLAKEEDNKIKESKNLKPKRYRGRYSKNLALLKKIGPLYKRMEKDKSLRDEAQWEMFVHEYEEEKLWEKYLEQMNEKRNTPK
jgi:hypothetical protein